MVRKNAMEIDPIHCVDRQNEVGDRGQAVPYILCDVYRLVKVRMGASSLEFLLVQLGGRNPRQDL